MTVAQIATTTLASMSLPSGQVRKARRRHRSLRRIRRKLTPGIRQRNCQRVLIAARLVAEQPPRMVTAAVRQILDRMRRAAVAPQAAPSTCSDPHRTLANLAYCGWSLTRTTCLQRPSEQHAWRRALSALVRLHYGVSAEGTQSGQSGALVGQRERSGSASHQAVPARCLRPRQVTAWTDFRPSPTA